jgi:hypothetical protein
LKGLAVRGEVAPVDIVKPEPAVPIRKSATPDNLICLGERSPSPRCRERSCIRSGYDRAGEFRREQGSCSPSRGEPAIARLLLLRARRRVSPA